MKPEMIMQSDVLDIMFEHRNKAYGAYALRKGYQQRLYTSIGITVLITFLFFLLQKIDLGIKEPTTLFSLPDGLVLTSVPLEKVSPPASPATRRVQTQRRAPDPEHAPPLIREDVKETTMPALDELNGETYDGPGTGGDEGGPGTGAPGGDGPGGPGDAPASTPDQAVEAEERVLQHADVMPKFNGDITKFMLRHLRQPDDLEMGERIVVRVKFVVTKEGDITDVEIIQSGRPDLDNEVMRVVKKMPKWSPGMQAGRAVPVFFYLPVTFLSNAE